MKKYIIVLLVLVLVGCSSNYDPEVIIETTTEYVDVPGEVVYIETPGEAVTEYSSPVSETNFQPMSTVNRLIIYYVDLSIRTDDIPGVYEKIEEKTYLYGGYIESENMSSSLYTVTIRVLSDNLDSFVDSISNDGEVVRYSKSSEDITTTYSTYTSRKEALEAQHTRLIELIAIAEDIETIIELEAQRLEVESELNQINNRLQDYDSLVEYSTVNIVLSKNPEQLLAQAKNPNIADRVINKEDITIKFVNNEEYQMTTSVQLLLNKEIISSKNITILEDDYIEVKFEYLEPYTEYELKVTTTADDMSQSDAYKTFYTTEKNLSVRTKIAFDNAINSVVSVTEFLWLALVTIFPYVIVIGAVGGVIIIIRKKKTP